jgi:polyhydroxyalkanoate synthesis regulator phasin
VTISSTGEPALGGADGSQVREEASAVTGTLKEQGSALADTVRDDGQRVANEAKEQFDELTEQAQQQLWEMVERAQQEFADRASEQSDKAASGLRSVAEELSALAEGRTGDAPHLVGHVRDVSQRARHYADRLEDGGIQGVGQDLAVFARRRPALFLLGAIAAGFATGRLVRGAQRGSTAGTNARLPGSVDLASERIGPAVAPPRGTTLTAPSLAVSTDDGSVAAASMGDPGVI